VNGAGSGSYPLAVFGVGDVDSSLSAVHFFKQTQQSKERFRTLSSLHLHL
jgi:hypothetical protein